ncbi:bifunctional 4-hydroxy-2-oxoglutarate aldolase/2-dehydro-3-deoxy-phosphogluconate aldolase [Pseudozobellia thermophila]|uniref:2-dehydro-3-deoxyphosphogluconate aldolase / (4S)-4-hydroxy-2-oxoglutarate aldolase n=1 Tax=Pseudozobellia thermophila TaxID=192903 RepID=A0A1M6GMY3_9FLAO|nr:bifunctional 4-hydroxy-2-oxoglutarate aldolase/2-dehydro-3-deoxy-phosphogluconate aldolase [Pseudozobellia thermophila]SHJ11318.1 2-dehydro-3-deoxyphosphogluconate aldolase / (4S)-4-hydroxy-2-oxoglutarate aldolase [Pseudozobellia thermophila]
MKNNTDFSSEKFEQTPVVGILRGYDLKTALFIAETYLKADFFTLEITMNSPNAAKIISSLRKNFPELNVGAGTVCDLTDLKSSLDAGSQFTVTPIINEEVILECASKKIPIFPGAYTPTEIYRAWNLGATAVKVFPATQLGPQFIKDVLAPLNKIKLLPTGGVDGHNLRHFFDAGAIGVGMGSSLFKKELITKKSPTGLLDHFRAIKNQIPPLAQQG